MREVLLVALGGAVGSVARYGARVALARAWPALPLGTLTVNVLGCFCFGLLAGATDDRTLRLALGTGVLGGFTTFSAFGGETLGLLDASPRLAALNVVGNVGLGLLSAGLGRACAAGLRG